MKYQKSMAKTDILKNSIEGVSFKDIVEYSKESNKNS